MSNYQGKHTKKPSNQETTTPRRARRYRGDYADTQRENPSEPEDARRSPEPEREAPVYVPPEVPQDNQPVNVAEQPTPDEGGSGRNIWVAVVVIAILLVIAALVLLGGSSLGWFGNNDHTDTTKLAEVANLSGTGTVEPVKPTPQVVYVYVTPEVTEVPTEVPTDVSTEAPTSTPTTKPTEAPTLELVKASPETPTEAPTMAPTKEPEPTEVPEVHAEYTETGTVTFAIEKQKKVTISRFTYAGGYIPDDDPWCSELEKEVEGSYGPSLEGETIEEGVYNWLHELPKSPLQIIRARVQIGLEKLDSLQAETQRAWEIARLPKAEYDEIANDTLEHLFGALEGGKILITTDWELENFMQEV
ncbi:hypothetical protein IIZ77_02985, partial [Candidatus Saccharibacteria bacterium]|nr:hypothetical protein [Candidatus Saccharibacteria bacterium]